MSGGVQTRRNRYGISDNSSFRVAIWYPATPQAGVMPQRFLYDREVHFWMDNWDYPAACPAPDTLWSYSFPDIPFGTPYTDPPSQHPIILYSHAGDPFAGHSEQVWHYAEYLASQGYIVMAPNHYDCWHTDLPDGSVYATATTPARDAAGFEDRMRDFEVLLDLFPEWQESDPILAGQLDLSNMGAMGFHFGAGIAAELCRTVDACKAGVLLNSWNGSFPGADSLLAEGPGKPLMFIQPTVNSWKDLYYRMEQDAVWFQLADSYWESLHAWYSWDNLLLGRPIEQNVIDHEITHTVQAYVGSFFSAKLLDEPEDVLWRGPSEDHPRVINYEGK